MDMQMEFVRKLPTPMEIKAQYPMSDELKELKEKRDTEIANIITGEDDRLMLVIGPCSADNEEAVVDYMTRLRGLQDKVSDKIYMVPRVYTNKPRTIGMGYKGMLHQPDPTKGGRYAEGIDCDSTDASSRGTGNGIYLRRGNALFQQS